MQVSNALTVAPARALSEIKKANQLAKSQKAGRETGNAALADIRAMLGPKPVNRLPRADRERAYLAYFFRHVFGGAE